LTKTVVRRDVRGMADVRDTLDRKRGRSNVSLSMERIRRPNDAWGAHRRDGTVARDSAGSDGRREAAGGIDVMAR
jgi:hypothetical protein